MLILFLWWLISHYLEIPLWLLPGFLLFLIRKKPRPWGKVVNSKTGQPVPKVRIKLHQAPAGKTPLTKRRTPPNRPSNIATTFTSNQGEFGFKKPKGRYIFEVNKSKYSIDTEKQAINTKPVFITEKMVMLKWDGETELRIVLKKDD